MGAVVSTIGHTLRTIAQGLCCTSRVGADRGDTGKMRRGEPSGLVFRWRPAEHARAPGSGTNSRPPEARPLSLYDLQQQAGNRAVVRIVGATGAIPGLVPSVPVQRAARTAEVRSAIARGDFSDSFTPPMVDGGTYYHLRGLSAADLAATIHGLRPDERSLLQVGGHGPRVGAASLRPRDSTALRAVSATGRLATAQRAVELVDALTGGPGLRAGTDWDRPVRDVSGRLPAPGGAARAACALARRCGVRVRASD
jgi:hypothetical protein